MTCLWAPSAAMRAPLLTLALLAAGCGSTEPATAPGEITDAEREGSQNALDLLRGRHPALLVEGSGTGIVLTIRRTGEAPVLVINGTRSSSLTGEAVGISAEEVESVEVLTALADTLVYGQEAARRGVVRITTRAARE